MHDNTFLYPILNFGICYRNKTWKFELKPDPYYIKKDDARLNRDSYIFQKLVPWKSVLTLGDKGTFHYSEARQLIEAVSYFFSFVFGRYMEPNLFIGFKSERPIIEKWEIQRFPWPIYHIPTWFNRYEAACLEKILPRFINLWESNSNAMREILEYHFIVKNEKHFPPQIRLSLLYSLAELFFDIKLKGNNNENKPEQLLKTINWVGVGNRESQIDEACNLHGLIERLHDQVCSNVSKCLYNKHSDEFYEIERKLACSINKMRNSYIHGDTNKPNQTQFDLICTIGNWLSETLVLKWLLDCDGFFLCQMNFLRLKKAYIQDLQNNI